MQVLSGFGFSTKHTLIQGSVRAVRVSMSSYARQKTIYFYLFAYVIVWSLMRWLMDANLDGYGDMLENYAWSRTFVWGTFKHPPLFAWVTMLWFKMCPTSNLSYHFLAYANAAIGLLGVFHLARAFGMHRYAASGALLLTMAFPYSTLAVKFNANSILLSVWPWLACAFINSTRNKTPARNLLWSIALGILAGMAMMAKYFSGVFFLCMFIASLVDSGSRRWYGTWKPWLASLVFCLCLSPHVSWLFENDFVTLKYAAKQGAGYISWGHVFSFALIPVYYWILPWLLCCIFIAPPQKRWHGLFGRMAKSWLPVSWSDQLFWLVMLSWMISLGFGLSGSVELSTPWAIPIGFGFSLLWLRNLSKDMEDSIAPGQKMIKTSFWVFLAIGLLIAAPAYTWWEASKSFRNYYLPRQLMVQELLKEWRRRYPHQELKWVGGQLEVSGPWGENASIAFYGNHDIRIVSGFPDQPLNPDKGWSLKPGLFLCALERVEDAKNQSVEMREKACVNYYKNWIEGQGKKPDVIYMRLHRTGWLFPRVVEFDCAAVLFLP
jgi:4-amino-4-deoxy-L-arabinose transferase-like glycosyltransferase